MLPKCRTGYEVVIPAGYHGFKDAEETIFVDSQNKDDVYYMFHVFVDDPDVKINICYSSGVKKRIFLEDINEN